MAQINVTTGMFKDMSREKFLKEIEAICDSRDRNRRKSHNGLCFADSKLLVEADRKFYPDADYTAFGR